MRLLNIVIIIALVVAAAYVYRIKFDSALQAERVAKLRTEIRRERDAIATLRSQWARLDNPDRIERLGKRHLPLKPMDATQFDYLDRLPERPPELVPHDSGDPIGAMIESTPDIDTPTGSISAPTTAAPMDGRSGNEPAPNGE